MSWSKAKKRAHNRDWMRRKRAVVRKHKGIAGWKNLFKVVRKGA